MDGFASPTIRRVTENDIPWLHELCAHAYPKGFFDPVASEIWVRRMLTSNDHLCIRGERSWLVATVNCAPWNPKVKVGSLLPVSSFGDATEEIRGMLSTATSWAREKGATLFFFSAITGYDFGPLVVPMGAKTISPAYVLEL